MSIPIGRKLLSGKAKVHFSLSDGNLTINGVILLRLVITCWLERLHLFALVPSSPMLPPPIPWLLPAPAPTTAARGEQSS